jgi:hypothetical protein
LVAAASSLGGRCGLAAATAASLPLRYMRKRETGSAASVLRQNKACPLYVFLHVHTHTRAHLLVVFVMPILAVEFPGRYDKSRLVLCRAQLTEIDFARDEVANKHAPRFFFDTGRPFAVPSCREAAPIALLKTNLSALSDGGVRWLVLGSVLSSFCTTVTKCSRFCMLHG